MVALPCAFLLKRFQGAPAEDAQRHKDLAFSGTVYEIALVVMSAYMAYLTAEVSLQPSCSASPDDLQENRRLVSEAGRVFKHTS